MIMTKIFDQPFNQELSKGILAKEKFIHYLQQDALYLADYSRALALTAARLTCNEQAHQFMQFALGAIRAEQDLHLNYLKKYQSPVTLSMEQSPVCFMYTNYLLRMASTASVEEAVASLLPCFWVYREVGKKISKAKSANNPYENWIDLYSGEQFDSSVKLAIDVTNALSDIASDDIKRKMISAFVRSTQLEWHFWESAYTQEKWLPC
ncbi:MAG: TenA family protein [Gammaproteobacteria bacterium]